MQIKIRKNPHNINVINKFQERLKELRLGEGITQKALAEKLGRARTSIYEWETKGHQPDYDTLIEIAKYFNVTIDYLLDACD